jgi:hypothetical protein
MDERCAARPHQGPVPAGRGVAPGCRERTVRHRAPDRGAPPGGAGWLTIRRSFFALVSSVETAVVSLGRVCDMVMRASLLIVATTPVPATIAAKAVDLTAIATSTSTLSRSPSTAPPEGGKADVRWPYARHREDLPKLIAEAREFMKEVAGNSCRTQHAVDPLSPASSTTNATWRWSTSPPGV